MTLARILWVDDTGSVDSVHRSLGGIAEQLKDLADKPNLLLPLAFFKRLNRHRCHHSNGMTYLLVECWTISLRWLDHWRTDAACPIMSTLTQRSQIGAEVGIQFRDLKQGLKSRLGIVVLQNDG